MPGQEAVERTGTLHVFGHGDTRVRAGVQPRSTGWRLIQAFIRVGAGLLLAPVAFFAPPHGAWTAAALLAGLVLGVRKWMERDTLLMLDGPCPRCGESVTLERPIRLRNPWTLDCEACHHALTMNLEPPDSPA
jgi:hypothetical protein